MRNHVQAGPSIRFKGFAEDWEQRKLGEMLKTHALKPYLEAPTEGGTIEVIQQGDRPVAGYAEGYPFEDYENITLFGDHTVSLYKPSAPFFVATDGVKILSADGFAGNFLYTLLERYKPNSQGYKRHFTILKNQNSWITNNVLEQTKIGTFFKQLDTTITLQQQQLDNYREWKKALLQKMFPKDGEKSPEVRFEGFAGEWEERKLGEIVLVTMGQSPNGENYTDNPKDHILVQGNADMKRGRVVPRVWTTQVTKTAEPEDIILSVRAPVGDVGKTDYSVVLGRGVAGIKGNEFIFQTILRMKAIGFWKRYSSGSTFESINSADLKDALIQIPSEEEQAQIGAFFKQLDDTITHHQQQLDNYKELKKTMLQKMF